MQAAYKSHFYIIVTGGEDILRRPVLESTRAVFREVIWLNNRQPVQAIAARLILSQG